MTGNKTLDDESDSNSDEIHSETEMETETTQTSNYKRKLENKGVSKNKKSKISQESVDLPWSEDEISEDDLTDQSEDDLSDQSKHSESDGNEATGSCEQNDSEGENENDGTWEDIYGRLRSKDGSIIKVKECSLGLVTKQKDFLVIV